MINIRHIQLGYQSEREVKLSDSFILAQQAQQGSSRSVWVKEYGKREKERESVCVFKRCKERICVLECR